MWALNRREFARPPGDLGLADVRIIEAIDEAARSGRTVEVARS
ncbi:MAG: hypothetical protein ABIT71_15605 [Vicinamibacteraceae bacterium]